LGWMRSSETVDDVVLMRYITSNGQWSYSDIIKQTPLRYFENNQVRSKALALASLGQEWLYDANKHLIGLPHIWDGGNYFPLYKNQNGGVFYDWASWEHFGASKFSAEECQYSIRRFSAYVDYTADDLKNASSVFLAPQNELGEMSYLMPINDTVFVFVNGKLAYWGGTDIKEGQNQYGALLRTHFSGKAGIPVRNGVNGVFKGIYPHTDGWCIDLESNRDFVNIKPLLKEGFNRIDVFTDDFWEGGGMNRLYLFDQ